MDAKWIEDFPPGFKFGVATSAYQIEGAVTEDGRGPSIWDTFSHTPGIIADGTTGDMACDHYHRYADDVGLMQRLDIDSYRFSLAWPRILPNGHGPINARGLAFYDALVDALLEKHIEPCVTLYHWDLPQALQDHGGWTHRDTAKVFQEYVTVASRALGDRVKCWITHNEPWCTAALGYFTGINAPGWHQGASAIQVGHHVLYSHGLGVRTIREEVPGAQIGLSLNLKGIIPFSNDEADQTAADTADIYHNRWFLDPLFKGRYPKDLTRVLNIAGFDVPTWGFDIIQEPIDFLGINYYTTDMVSHAESPDIMPFHIVSPKRVTEMGWPIVPEGLHDILLRVSNEYTRQPLYITENGAAYPDSCENDQVHDGKRIEYLSQHLQALGAALREGVDVRRYYVWSLLDNYEWEWGYSRRFGLVYVDYATQKRIVKDSGWWYQAVNHHSKIQRE